MRTKLFPAAVAILTLLGLTEVRAQNDRGDFTIMPKAGLNLATWAGDPDAKMMPAYIGGFELELGLTENVGLVTGVHYSMQGEKDKEFDLKMKFDYTNVPFLVLFYPVKGLAVKAGAQLGFLSRKRFEFDGERYDLDRLESITGEKSSYRNFDLAIPMGLSYELYNFVVDVRYNFGLINIVKDFDETYRNSVLQFTLGYKIPLTD